MTPKDRERAYEKKRYEKYQERVAARQAAARKRARMTAAIVGSALLMVAIGGGIFLALNRGDNDSLAAADPDNSCPAPTVQPPAEPRQFDAAPPPADAENRTWTFTMQTSCGEVVAELDGANAPQAVAAMRRLGESDYFEGSPCHRLTTAGIFVLQCGDPTGTGSGSPGFTYGPIENAPEDFVYPAGTIAMARGQAPDSHGSQFFIVYRDSTIGDATNGAYTVLGTITEGLDVIQNVADGGVTDGASDGAPVRPISIVETSVQAG